MSDIVHNLAVKAGVRYIEGMELCNGRAYMANLKELVEFARLVGEVARKNERQKLLKDENERQKLLNGEKGLHNSHNAL